MNYIIFTAVLTAYLGIGGNQPTYAQFSPEPQEPKGILYNELTHCGIPVHKFPKCDLDHIQGPAERNYHSLGSKWAFIHSQKIPLETFWYMARGGQGSNMDFPILGVLQQYLGLLVLVLGLLHLSFGLLLLRLGLMLLKLGLWCRA
ncbi:hypothetical protein DSO57_1018499 [Entomophthora muscae]|uniref:Uncharacterized protein n=1 Tax=Entomophthora muscae TaxID=34485 RepID=A0ACC2SH21_9FUNG|nr:hypothetical protein DSO57_1018499 [Entomophthora muscae]